MKHDELGELSAAEVEFIKQTRGKMGSKPEPTAEQLTAEKRARFQKLVGLSAGKWSAEDQAFMRDECMKDLLAGRLPFGG